MLREVGKLEFPSWGKNLWKKNLWMKIDQIPIKLIFFFGKISEINFQALKS